MASVTLDRVWLHRAGELGTYLRFFSTDRTDQRNTSGDVRMYSGGRLRSVTRTGSRQQLGLTLRQVSDDALVTLEDWRGALLLLRDHRGRLLWGSYFALDVTDYQDRSGYDVSLTFLQVTHSAEV